MKTTFALAAAVLCGGLAFGTAVSATPIAVDGSHVAQPGFTQARMMSSDRMMMKKRMMRKQMMRRHMMKRRMMQRM